MDKIRFAIVEDGICPVCGNEIHMTECPVCRGKQEGYVMVLALTKAEEEGLSKVKQGKSKGIKKLRDRELVEDGKLTLAGERVIKRMAHSVVGEERTYRGVPVTVVRSNARETTVRLDNGRKLTVRTQELE